MARHFWLRAGHLHDRERLRATLDLPPPLGVLDAHRRLRGPYTAAGTLLRSIAHDALARCPGLGERHNVEIGTCAPELTDLVPSPWRTLEWTVGKGERTRFYSRLHTLNISNGLAEVLRDYLRALGGPPRTLVIENLHHADPTDQELAAVLVRRGDLGPLTVVVGSGLEAIADPPGEPSVSLMDTLHAHTTPVDGPPAGAPAELADAPTEDVEALAAAYVASDGTSDDPLLLAGYRQLPPRRRALLHDERAAELARAGEPSLLLGAVPYHAEHGSDPPGAGVAALKHALDQCRNVGLYQAAVEHGLRGRALLDHSTRPEMWWHFAEGTATCMASLGRAAEAEAIHDEVRAASTDPTVHMTLAYGTAMLYARHYAFPERDYDKARAWMNLAIAIAGLLEDPKQRSFHSVFNRNGLALVEVRQNRPGEALRLLEQGMARLDRELEPGEHGLHRIVLRYNRAQIHGMTGRLEDALDDYAAVVKADPDFPEHHFNVANILRRLGRNQQAIASYEQALRISPPFPEAYYNLGDARLDLGDAEQALEDFGYTIELDPAHVDARVNRAGLLCDLGDHEAARRDVDAGLALDGGNAYLLCLKGRLLAEDGDAGAAAEALSAALASNPRLAEAWATRGVLAFEAGDVDGAIGDLSRALELDDNPAARFNRGVAYRRAARYQPALEDFEAVLAATGDDDARRALDDCRKAMSERAGV